MTSKILQNPDKESKKAAVASFHTIKSHVLQMNYIASCNKKSIYKDFYMYLQEVMLQISMSHDNHWIFECRPNPNLDYHH